MTSPGNNYIFQYRYDVFDKFRSNMQLASQNHRTSEQKDQQPQQPVQQIKKKISKGLIAAEVAGVSALAVGIGFTVLSKNRNNGLAKFVDSLSARIKDLEKLENADGLNLVEKVYLVASKSLRSVTGVALSCLANLDNVKNVLVQKLIENDSKAGAVLLKPFKAYAKGVTKLFEDFAKVATQRKYKAVRTRLNDVTEMLQEMKQKADSETQRKAIDQFINKVKGIKTIISDDAVHDRFSGLRIKAHSSFKDDYNKELNKILKDKSLGSFVDKDGKLIAERVFDPYLSDFINKDNKCAFKKLDEGLNHLIEDFKNIGLNKNDPDAKHIDNLLTKADGKLKAAVKFEKDDLTGKMRDLALGGAIMDASGLVLPVVFLANEIHDGKTKEEKMHTAVATGSTVFGGIGAWIYSAAIRCLNGGPAILFSLGTGIVFSKVGGFVADKLYGKQEPKKPANDHTAKHVA